MPQQTIARPDLLDGVDNDLSNEFGVIVFDNDHNTVPEVIAILMKATGCPLPEAEMETWEIHHQGRSLVHHGDRAECERVANVIETIGIKVSVDQI